MWSPAMAAWAKAGISGSSGAITRVHDGMNGSTPAGAPRAAVLAQGERGGGDDGERERAVRQRARRRGERAVERVADERERARPDERAEQAPRQERADAHAGCAGQERGDGADDADEAPDEDRLGAVAVEERLDAGEPLGGHAEARPARDQEAAAEAAAEHEARDAAEHDGRLARRDEPHERAGLEEGERRDERVRPRPERLGEVGERALEVGQ